MILFPPPPEQWNPKKPLIAGISGGSDSMCLLDLLFSSGYSSVIVAHLDHSLRKESKKDSNFVKKIAKQYGFLFENRKKDIKKIAQKKKENIEAIGRQERYSFFESLKKKYHAVGIVTAHHADDQVETILLNIIRGCGLDGLKGMKLVEHGLWRPLTSFSKKEILRYCKQHHLPFIQESTNTNLRFRRNFLRLKIIPLLKRLNPNLLSTIENNRKIWQSASDFFESRARNFLEKHRIKKHRYDLRAFLKLHLIEKQYLLRFLFQELYGHKKNLSQHHLDQVLKILMKKTSGKQKEFGENTIIRKNKEWFEIIPSS